MAPSKLPTRKIGTTDVCAMGYGAMGLGAVYGDHLSQEERFKVLDALYEMGCTNWDTADIYADSEDTIGAWFKKTGKRNEIFLATKFGFTIGNPDAKKPISGDPEYVHASMAKSLSRLGVDSVDLYYFHRPDPTVPIEVTVGAMAELVKQGKTKYIGLSEVSASTLRRAHAVHPIAAVQVEYSPFVLDIEDEKIGLLAAARELGVAIVAYSPLGRGLITGRYRSPDDLPPDDFRRSVPRYSAANFPNILAIADDLAKIGKAHGATAGQVALAWLLAQGPDVIPIPGSTKIANLKENLGALELTLTPDEAEEVRRIAEMADALPGARYPPGLAEMLFADTPSLTT
ncbi:Aldo/keto reductase [Epithele typhae]|uniref:Aldo/keto reductase n=1 Tax=Epithele typhae TaxID=378194 RepID=UPI002008E95E|nr:Aldo/keto reductase [Epithele typhae]KAH9930536.1 Aldo/keto reductase [Epithele typhae]